LSKHKKIVANKRQIVEQHQIGKCEKTCIWTCYDALKTSICMKAMVGEYLWVMCNQNFTLCKLPSPHHLPCTATMWQGQHYV